MTVDYVEIDCAKLNTGCVNVDCAKLNTDVTVDYAKLKTLDAKLNTGSDCRLCKVKHWMWL